MPSVFLLFAYTLFQQLVELFKFLCIVCSRIHDLAGRRIFQQLHFLAYIVQDVEIACAVFVCTCEADIVQAHVPGNVFHGIISPPHQELVGINL